MRRRFQNRARYEAVLAGWHAQARACPCASQAAGAICADKIRPIVQAEADSVKKTQVISTNAAIDMTKEDRNSTWERRARQSKRITRWNQPANTPKGNRGKPKSWPDLADCYEITCVTDRRGV